MAIARFYPIFENSGWLERLVPLGIEMVQLRIKEKPLDFVRQDIRKALGVCRRHGCQLIVNDYWQIAIEEACEFVHLGQEDLARADIAAIRSAGIRLGISTHDGAELRTALNARPDYIAFGPVYATILKEMKWRPQGLERLAEWKKRIGDVPLVAIGGFTVERADGAFAAGADCVSAVTDITLDPDPEARTRAWLAAAGTASGPTNQFNQPIKRRALQ